ncbi:MAG: hypothetical protein ABWX67_02385 [Allosphingosinicella sp.]
MARGGPAPRENRGARAAGVVAAAGGARLLDGADRAVGELVELAPQTVAAEAELVELALARLARGEGGLAGAVVDLAADRAEHFVLAAGARQQGGDEGSDGEAADDGGDGIGIDAFAGPPAGALIGAARPLARGRISGGGPLAGALEGLAGGGGAAAIALAAVGAAGGGRSRPIVGGTRHLLAPSLVLAASGAVRS